MKARHGTTSVISGSSVHDIGSSASRLRSVDHAHLAGDHHADGQDLQSEHLTALTRGQGHARDHQRTEQDPEGPGRPPGQVREARICSRFMEMATNSSPVSAADARWHPRRSRAIPAVRARPSDQLGTSGSSGRWCQRISGTLAGAGVRAGWGRVAPSHRPVNRR